MDCLMNFRIVSTALLRTQCIYVFCVCVTVTANSGSSLKRHQMVGLRNVDYQFPVRYESNFCIYFEDFHTRHG